MKNSHLFLNFDFKHNFISFKQNEQDTGCEYTPQTTSGKVYNENEILKRIRAKVGLEMTRSADFDVLSQSIKDTTNENLGVNTLKRLFGFKTEKVVPRLSTMDIIAQYLGSSDYETLIKELGEDADISLFTPVDCIEVQELAKGSQIQISYVPELFCHP